MSDDSSPKPEEIPPVRVAAVRILSLQAYHGSVSDHLDRILVALDLMQDHLDQGRARVAVVKAVRYDGSSSNWENSARNNFIHPTCCDAGSRSIFWNEGPIENLDWLGWRLGRVNSYGNIDMSSLVDVTYCPSCGSKLPSLRKEKGG